MTPKEVRDSTTSQVRNVIDEILKIEKANKHIQNLSAIKSKEAEVVEEILKVFYREVK
jgi:hypothetical protein